jgi:hypothetical protein
MDVKAGHAALACMAVTYGHSAERSRLPASFKCPRTRLPIVRLACPIGMGASASGIAETPNG